MNNMYHGLRKRISARGEIHAEVVTPYKSVPPSAYIILVNFDIS
jgi:hypothetical protein